MNNTGDLTTTSSFTQGPLSGAGNGIAFDSNQRIIYYVMLAMVFLTLIALSVYSPKLKLKYFNVQSKYSNGSIKTSGPGYVVGFFIIFMSLFRILLYTNAFNLVNTVYPHLGELIPLHGSRIVLIPITIVCFGGHKIRSSNGNFLGILISISTSSLAFTKPDLNGNAVNFLNQGETFGGYNSYTFGDYFFIHAINFTVPGIIIILYRPVLTLKVFGYAILTAGIYLIIIFALDGILAATLDSNNATQERGIANGAFLSGNVYNPNLSNLLPPLSLGPFSLLVYMVGISITSSIVAIAYYYSDIVFAYYIFGYDRTMYGNFINMCKSKFTFIKKKIYKLKPSRTNSSE